MRKAAVHAAARSPAFATTAPAGRDAVSTKRRQKEAGSAGSVAHWGSKVTHRAEGTSACARVLRRVAGRPKQSEPHSKAARIAASGCAEASGRA